MKCWLFRHNTAYTAPDFRRPLALRLLKPKTVRQVVSLSEMIFMGSNADIKHDSLTHSITQSLTDSLTCNSLSFSPRNMLNGTMANRTSRLIIQEAPSWPHRKYSARLTWNGNRQMRWKKFIMSRYLWASTAIRFTISPVVADFRAELLKRNDWKGIVGCDVIAYAFSLIFLHPIRHFVSYLTSLSVKSVLCANDFCFTEYKLFCSVLSCSILQVQC